MHLPTQTHNTMNKHILWWNNLPIETMNTYRERIEKTMFNEGPIFCTLETLIFQIWVENGCPEPPPIIDTTPTHLPYILIGILLAALAIYYHCN